MSKTINELRATLNRILKDPTSRASAIQELLDTHIRTSEYYVVAKKEIYESIAGFDPSSFPHKEGGVFAPHELADHLEPIYSLLKTAHKNPGTCRDLMAKLEILQAHGACTQRRTTCLEINEYRVQNVGMTDEIESSICLTDFTPMVYALFLGINEIQFTLNPDSSNCLADFAMAKKLLTQAQKDEYSHNFTEFQKRPDLEKYKLINKHKLSYLYIRWRLLHHPAIEFGAASLASRPLYMRKAINLFTPPHTLPLLFELTQIKPEDIDGLEIKINWLVKHGGDLHSKIPAVSEGEPETLLEFATRNAAEKLDGDDTWVRAIQNHLEAETPRKRRRTALVVGRPSAAAEDEVKADEGPRT